MQLALASVPLIIAGAGLAAALGVESFAEVVARTVVALSPGTSDALVADVVEAGPTRAASAARWWSRSGLITAFVAATSAFAQLERGANRIYGTKRDRPALRKYAFAALLTATAGVAMAVGLLLIVAGEPFGEALEQVYRWGDAAETWWDALRWPIGLAALVVAVTVLFQHAPRRKQPGLSWLAVGAAVTVLAWLFGSGLLAIYVAAAAGFDETYGPLTAVMALLLWANVTGVALLAGIALAAQLEAVRLGPRRTRCSPTPTTTASPTSSTSTPTPRPADPGGSAEGDRAGVGRGSAEERGGVVFRRRLRWSGARR